MNWNIIDIYSLSSNWQFTETTEGSFFKFRFSDAMLYEKIWIAQASNDDAGLDTLTLFDLKIVEVTLQDCILDFTKPTFLTNRRIAIRRAAFKPDLTQVLRNNLVINVLKPNSSSLPPSLYQGKVEIAVLDSPPLNLPQTLPQNNQIPVWDAEQQKLVFKDLKDVAPTPPDPTPSDTSAPSNEQPSSQTTTTTSYFTYQEDGDSNGLFFGLGTNKGQISWENPVTSGKLKISLSSNLDPSFADTSKLCNRSVDEHIATADLEGSYILIELAESQTFAIESYSLRQRDSDTELLLRWKIETSNDKQNWEPYAFGYAYTNEVGTATRNKWIHLSPGLLGYARYFKLTQTHPNSSGNNILSLGEIELYGVLKDVSAQPNNSQSQGSSSKELSFNSFGDTNGLFYWIGTNYGTTNWENPAYRDKIVITQSSRLNQGHFNPSELTNRAPGYQIATASIPSSYFQFRLLDNYSLQCKSYTIQQRNYSGSFLNNWKLQASKDGEAWTDLGNGTDPSPVESKWLKVDLSPSTEFYSFFRLVQIGTNSSKDNIFAIGEWEFYGTLKQGV